MGNNEDYILPGKIWFVSGKRGKLGRVNVGFETDFAQGSMNEAGLCFDGAALQPVPWEADPDKPTPKNLVEDIMDTCTTVDEAIQQFKANNAPFLKNSQILFADAQGNSAVIAWLPGKGLSIVQGNGKEQIITNTRLEASGYRCQRHVRATQLLAKHNGAPHDTVVSMMEGIHQRGPKGFTSYSVAYDLKRQKLHLYNLANFKDSVVFDLKEELAKKRSAYTMAELFEEGPTLKDIKAGPQRTQWDTQVTLATEVLDRYVGKYSPLPAPNIVVEVKRTGDLLQVQNPGQPPAKLYPESDTLFRIKPDRGQVSFQLDDKGAVLSLTLHKQQDVVAKMVVE